MKKLLGIVVLGLLIYQPTLGDHESGKERVHPIPVITWTSSDVITSEDPTTFKKLIYEGEQEIKMWQNITKKRTATKKTSKSVKKKRKAYTFTAHYEDDSPIIIYATPKYGSKDKAEEQALTYGKMIGQLPTFLKKGIETIHLNKSDNSWFWTSEKKGSPGTLVIHSGYYILDYDGACYNEPCLWYHEELLLHEAAHAFFNPLYFNITTGKISKKLLPEKWKLAVKADKKEAETGSYPSSEGFVSWYASTLKAEDLVESLHAWIIVRYRKDKLPKHLYKKITSSIPNRLKYFDEQNYDVYPLVSK